MARTSSTVQILAARITMSTSGVVTMMRYASAARLFSS